MPDRDDSDEDDLFRAAMRGVRPLKSSARVQLARDTPAPVPRQRIADDLQVMKELLAEPDPEWVEAGETLHYRAPGVQDGVLRKLRRGQYRIQAELDLHGLNRDQARAAVTHFIADCLDRERRCVRIVHGKGNGSPNSGPVLKSYLDGWLRKHRRVMAFCSAPPHDGGTGAVYALLGG
ncbi:MAG TPA: Smr/MutS family protein [Solimonas sp.]